MKRIITLVCFVLALASPASASTILQFLEVTFNNPVTIAANGLGTQTTISVVDAPVNLVFDPAFCLNLGCNGATSGVYLFNLNATSAGPATLVNGGQDLNQSFNGTLSFTSGATNLLTVNFSDQFAGAVGGSTPTMAASQPPDTFSGSSNILDPFKLGVPRGFSLSFSNFAGGVALDGATLGSSTADVTGTFNATPAAVPEPGTLVLFGSGLLGLAALVPTETLTTRRHGGTVPLTSTWRQELRR